MDRFYLQPFDPGFDNTSYESVVKQVTGALKKFKLNVQPCLTEGVKIHYIYSSNSIVGELFQEMHGKGKEGNFILAFYNLGFLPESDKEKEKKVKKEAYQTLFDAFGDEKLDLNEIEVPELVDANTNEVLRLLKTYGDGDDSNLKPLESISIEEDKGEAVIVHERVNFYLTQDGKKPLIVEGEPVLRVEL